MLKKRAKYVVYIRNRVAQLSGLGPIRPDLAEKCASWPIFAKSVNKCHLDTESAHLAVRGVRNVEISILPQPW